MAVRPPVPDLSNPENLVIHANKLLDYYISSDYAVLESCLDHEI